jgi:hypothetical protein
MAAALMPQQLKAAEWVAEWVEAPEWAVPVE